MDEAEITEERGRIKANIQEHKNRLHFIEIRVARAGINADHADQAEIVDIKAKIQYLYEKLDVLNEVDSCGLFLHRDTKYAKELVLKLSELIDDETDTIDNTDGQASVLVNKIEKTLDDIVEASFNRAKAEKEYRKL